MQQLGPLVPRTNQFARPTLFTTLLKPYDFKRIMFHTRLGASLLGLEKASPKTSLITFSKAYSFLSIWLLKTWLLVEAWRPSLSPSLAEVLLPCSYGRQRQSRDRLPIWIRYKQMAQQMAAFEYFVDDVADGFKRKGDSPIYDSKQNTQMETQQTYGNKLPKQAWKHDDQQSRKIREQTNPISEVYPLSLKGLRLNMIRANIFGKDESDNISFEWRYVGFSYRLHVVFYMCIFVDIYWVIESYLYKFTFTIEVKDQKYSPLKLLIRNLYGKQSTAVFPVQSMYCMVHLPTFDYILVNLYGNCRYPPWIYHSPWLNGPSQKESRQQNHQVSYIGCLLFCMSWSQMLNVRYIYTYIYPKTTLEM